VRQCLLHAALKSVAVGRWARRGTRAALSFAVGGAQNARSDEMDICCERGRNGLLKLVITCCMCMLIRVCARRRSGMERLKKLMCILPRGEVNEIWCTECVIQWSNGMCDVPSAVFLPSQREVSGALC
jgi:hypothetical protein